MISIHCKSVPLAVVMRIKCWGQGGSCESGPGRIHGGERGGLVEGGGEMWWVLDVHFQRRVHS